MPEYKSIVEFLLSGVVRMHPAERTEALCGMFAGLLPEMSPDEIADVRQQVEARCWGTPGMTEALLDLIEGHLALREIFSDAVEDCSSGPESQRSPDYEV